jgi:hypothetical protein
MCRQSGMPARACCRDDARAHLDRLVGDHVG